MSSASDPPPHLTSLLVKIFPPAKPWSFVLTKDPGLPPRSIPFNIPGSFAQFIHRISRNATRFQTNYLLFSMLCQTVSVIHNPIILIVAPILIGIWYTLFFRSSRRERISTSQYMTFSVPFIPFLSVKVHLFWILLGMTAFTVACIFFTGSFVVHTFVSWLCAIVCLTHAAMRRIPGDDESFGDVLASDAAIKKDLSVRQFVRNVYDDVKDILSERNEQTSSVHRDAPGLERRRGAQRGAMTEELNTDQT